MFKKTDDLVRKGVPKPSKAETQNQKSSEVKQFLENPEVLAYFKTREGQDHLERMKIKQGGINFENSVSAEESGIGQSTIHLVTQRLGQGSTRCIMDHCCSGKMSSDAMEAFAERLGRDKTRPNVLLGRHKARMGRNSLRNFEDEMQDILGDWWTHHCLHQIPQRTALEQLIKIFDEIDGCKPLAFKLKGALERGYSE